MNDPAERAPGKRQDLTLDLLDLTLDLTLDPISDP
jgi:hypothetical protein